MRNLIYMSTVLLIMACARTKHKAEVTEMNPLNSYPSKTISASFFNVRDSLLAPVSIRIADTVAIIETNNKTGIFHLYSLNSGALLKTYGNIGRAGNEYLFPQMFQNDAEHIIVCDKMKFDVINIQALLSEERYTPDRSRVPALSAVNFMALIDSSNIVFNSASVDEQLIFLNMNTDRSILYNNFPEIIKVPGLNNFISQTQVFRAISTYHAGQIAMGYALFPIVDIVDTKTMKPKRISFPIHHKHNKVTVIDKLNAVIDDPFYCYGDICATEKYLYLLYFGATEKDLDAMNVNVEIHKFDFDGNLIVRYLPNKFITKIAVTPDDMQCYAISVNSDYEDSIVKFQLQ